MRTERRAWIWIGAAAAAVAAGLIAVSLLVNADRYRGQIEAALTKALGRQVTLGQLDASVLSGSLVATSPSIADDPAFESGPFVTAKEIKIGVELVPLLLRHELHITGFTIAGPKIVLLRAPNGRWNYSSLGGPAQAEQTKPAAPGVLPNLTVNKIDIEDGTVTVGTAPATGPQRQYTDLNASLKNFSFTGPFSFTLSGKLPGDGSLTVSGDAGPVAQGDASLTPATAQVELKSADLAAAGLVDAGAGVGGVADLSAKLVSNGQTAQVQGTATLTRLRLAKNGTPSPKPVDVRFQVSEDLRAMTGTIQQADVQVGKATLAATGTFATQGNATTARLQVNGQAMPIDDLESFLPSLGIELPAGTRLEGGTLDVGLSVSGPMDAPVADGQVKVANTQLTGFDLESRLKSVAALTGTNTGQTTTVQVLSSKVHYGPDGIRTDGIDAVVTGLGSATGSGTISPAGALDYRMTVTLSSGVGAVATRAMGLLSGALGEGAAKGGIPVRIGGTTSDPRFAPDLGAMTEGVAGKPEQAGKALGKKLGGLFGR